MRTAAANENGAMQGFMGMGMAMNAGGNNAQNLFAMGQQQSAQAYAQQMIDTTTQKMREVAASTPTGWKCACGAVVTGKFCTECGAKKPEPVAAEGWTCSCGAVNKGKFCPECGGKKPAGVPQYKCDKCGWEPEKGSAPPKFCPECGDPFDNGDIV